MKICGPLLVTALVATTGACFGSWLPATTTPGNTAVCAAPLPQVMWPLRGAVSHDWAIIAHVDHDPSTGLRDFMGHTGTDAITYDGHDGIDIGLASFEVMDLGIPVFAGLEGVVKRAEDGAPDRNTGQTPAELKRQANYVLVEAPGGYTVAYWHLRKGSVRVKPGDPVHIGQQIGEIGSSGNSSGPHLHLSMYDCNGATIDMLERHVIPNAPPYDPPAGFLEMRVTGVQGETVSLYLLFASVRKGDRIALIATSETSTPVELRVGNDGARQIPNFYWMPSFTFPAGTTWTLTTTVNDVVVDVRTWPFPVEPAAPAPM